MLLRLRGLRVGAGPLPSARDRFEHEEVVSGILPGTGPVSVTSWVHGVAEGEWAITGELVRSAGAAPGRAGGAGRRSPAEPLPRARWSWRRWAIGTAPAGSVRTRLALISSLAGMPGVLPGSWPFLGTVGAVVAFLTQAALLSGTSIPVADALIVSFVALLAGMLGAKLWYAVLNPGASRLEKLGGWAVDGFLVVAPVVAVGASLAVGLPVGGYLDSVTPGLFFGVAIGRVGCFFTGCCAGRPTRSRWGIWSSDRKIGARRIPAQLLESAAGLVIGLSSAVLVRAEALPAGASFVLAFAGYLAVRQALLRVRAEARPFSWRRSTRALTGTNQGR